MRARTRNDACLYALILHCSRFAAAASAAAVAAVKTDSKQTTVQHNYTRARARRSPPRRARAAQICGAVIGAVASGACLRSAFVAVSAAICMALKLER